MESYDRPRFDRTRHKKDGGAWVNISQLNIITSRIRLSGHFKALSLKKKIQCLISEQIRSTTDLTIKQN